MRKDKEKIFELRKLGKSFSELSKIFSIPKSTLSEWFKDHQWSKELSVSLNKGFKEKNIVRLSFLNKIRGDNLRKIYETAEQEAIEEFEKLKYHPLFIAGLMIYWGEGEKLGTSGVSISNVDPLMIKLFHEFLIRICSIDEQRIATSLFIYPDLVEEVCKSYWKEQAGLKNTRFRKTVTLIGKHKTRKIKYGICKLGCCSAYLKRKIIVWLKIFPESILGENYYMA